MSAHDPLVAFLRRVASAIAAEDGAQLSAAFCSPVVPPPAGTPASAPSIASALPQLCALLPPSHLVPAAADMKELGSGPLARALEAVRLPPLWQPVVCAALYALAAEAADGVDEATTIACCSFSHQCMLAYLPVIESPDTGAWTLPLLTVFLKRALAAVIAREQAQRKEGVFARHSQEAKDLLTSLRNYFAVIQKQKAPEGAEPTASKGMGILQLVNTMFKLSLRNNDLNSCHFIQRTVQSRPINFSLFPKAQVVQYQYCVGLVSLLCSNFASAEESLTLAATNCHVEARTNMQRIVRFLIPLRLIVKGEMAPPHVLREYGVQELYGDILEAVKTGNVLLFEEAMARNQLQFIRAGVFLLLQRLQLMVHRALLRRICTAIVANTGNSQIQLTQVLNIIQALGIDMDMDELLCLIANLKHMGAILCIMSFQPPLMALAKSGAFPRIADVTAKMHAPFGS